MVYVKHRDDKNKLTIYLFTERHYNLMQENYELGGCGVNEKGLVRYCDAYLPHTGRLFMKCQPIASEQRKIYRGVAKLFDVKEKENKRGR